MSSNEEVKNRARKKEDEEDEGEEVRNPEEMCPIIATFCPRKDPPKAPRPSRVPFARLPADKVSLFCVGPLRF